METPATVRDALRPGDWVTSIDLTDAYFHILILMDRKWLRFRWGDKAYQFRALPFGLSLAPWIFTMVVRQLCALIRQKGVRLRAYLDDWLILSQSQDEPGSGTLPIPYSLRPASSSRHGICDQSGQVGSLPCPGVHLSGHEIRHRGLDGLAFSQESDPASRFDSESGQTSKSASEAPCIHFGTNGVHGQACYPGKGAQAPFPGSSLSGLASGFPRLEDVSADSRVVPSHNQSVAADGLDHPGCTLIVPPPFSADLCIDASLSGWGAHLEQHTASGLWNAVQAESHINVLELEAVAQGLLSFLPHLRGRHVRILTDNTTVAAYLNNQGGVRSPSLSIRSCQILIWCQQHRITLPAKHLPGRLNVLADALIRSSRVVHTEWTITHHALQRLWAHIDKPMIDLFAMRFSKRLPLFVSPFPDPGLWAVNALELDWSGLSAYAFPPPSLLEKVLRKADLERPSLVLVAPMCTSQHWYPDLLRLSQGPPVPLNLVKGELLQPRTGVLRENLRSLQLHGWRLLGTHSNTLARRCWETLPLLNFGSVLCVACG
ncbi:hypothetical protein V1264_006669 [Littorina saxatilis]|uniref:Reverse transcriptase domain-containing protein n=1 Tax=Littorina saxatilis TaxID=31220 RepID=A0AAN9AXW3_9CAEN